MSDIEFEFEPEPELLSLDDIFDAQGVPEDERKQFSWCNENFLRLLELRRVAEEMAENQERQKRLEEIKAAKRAAAAIKGAKTKRKKKDADKEKADKADSILEKAAAAAGGGNAVKDAVEDAHLRVMASAVKRADELKKMAEDKKADAAVDAAMIVASAMVDGDGGPVSLDDLGGPVSLDDLSGPMFSYEDDPSPPPTWMDSIKQGFIVAKGALEKPVMGGIENVGFQIPRVSTDCSGDLLDSNLNELGHNIGVLFSVAFARKVSCDDINKLNLLILKMASDLLGSSSEE